ncbi:[FeFe] hydrogenase H-cluster radical SAM maturase HydG [Dehalococcoidia bacterium]|nr:[FeFe] hydrogenase H-cluster radical SAM maturase HydG [Dehalococcoidia bacterium]
MAVEVVHVDSWMKNRIKEEEYAKYMEHGRDFLPQEEITARLEASGNPDPERVKDILAKSLDVQTLEPDETAVLLNINDERLLQEMEEAARRVKRKVYDNRIVTFAPLYMSNLCINNCLYCGFRKDNRRANRKVLSLEEVRQETEVLVGEIGHKRLIVVYGEHPSTDIDYMVSTIESVYGVKVKSRNGWANIRRVNVNAPPLSVEDLRRLSEVGIGTYQVFQETYHRPTYERLHPGGTIKSDYQWRLYCMHRAMEAGLDDVGIGVLFGLYDWKFEVMGLLYHARELEGKFGVGPHTVSFPRLEPALDIPFTEHSPYEVTDEDFKRIITVVRLAIPYTGMILTARESPEIRRDVIHSGVTQTDASSKIGIGAYAAGSQSQEGSKQQFYLGDTRDLDEVVRELARMGYITSFCTAGYRCGRTGGNIMELLRSGKEGKFCKLNAVLTFREWVDGFASEETRVVAEEIIAKEISEIKETMPEIFPHFMKYYDRIRQGETDLYF